SGYILSHSERSVIRGRISTSEAATRALEAELSNLQSQLSYIREFTKFQKSLLSPIGQLPDDILGEIFNCICEHGISIGSRWGRIWSLMQVCSRWRNVAQSTPSLW
ncbi:hypothetical protein BDQ17DRAFT_1207910, partial [Cyathus striatus]